MKRNYSSNKISGVIIDATKVKEVSTNGRHHIKEAKLWICNETKPEGIEEVVVTVTGDNVNYVGCVGSMVECVYKTRSFIFTNKKTGDKDLGNEHIAEKIGIIRYQ